MTDPKAREDSLPEMTPTELHERMERGEPVVLVDVRELHEQHIADLPEYGQLRMPLGELLARVEELDADRTTVLYCRSGSRSGWATRQLLARGHGKAWNLKGGLLGWKEEVDPSIQEY